MFKKISITLILSLSLGFSAVNFPYPQEKSYGNGTINATSANRSSTLKNRFESFLTRFYEPGTCSGKPCARIKWDTPAQTVSEGIGYGMIVMVYFSDNTTSYQDHFDRLWTYYQSFLNGNKLMNWKINGFSNVTNDGQNAATDAELDVALALVMAHYQFGTSSGKNYLDTARSLISKIRSYEVSTNNLIKPGDAWDSERNPSYVSPATFEIFKQVESGQAAKWQSVIDANYTMLRANQNSTSGLFSDWCRDNGSHSRGNYGYDAARTPWRIAWANAWYGHADAKTLLSNLYSKFLQNKNGSDIAGALQLTGGSAGNDKNSTFVGPFTNALSTSANQTKMDNYWGVLMGFTNEPYYSATLQLLTGLLASGNMPNLANSTPGGPSSSSRPSSSSGGASGSQIDKFSDAGNESEDDRGFAKTWEPWYAYTDKGSDGSSTIANAKSRKQVWNKEKGACEEDDAYTVVLQDGSDWVAKITSYTLNQGNNLYEPYVALGLDAEYNGTGGTSKYSFSGCTGGFSYEYKGEAHNFKVQLSTVEDYAYHAMEVTPAKTAWTQVVAEIEELRQPSSWGVKVPFNLNQINSFSWELKGDATVDGKPVTGISKSTGSLAIKNFKCLGTMTFPSYYAPRCGSATPRSSSSGGSSSGVSSSSGTTPVILHQGYLSNGLNAMRNAVNLQAAGNAIIQIFDLKGNAVRTQSFAQGSYIVSMANLPKGLYIVKASSGSWKQTVTVPVR